MAGEGVTRKIERGQISVEIFFLSAFSQSTSSFQLGVWLRSLNRGDLVFLLLHLPLLFSYISGMNVRLQQRWRLVIILRSGIKS